MAPWQLQNKKSQYLLNGLFFLGFFVVVFYISWFALDRSGTLSSTSRTSTLNLSPSSGNTTRLQSTNSQSESCPELPSPYDPKKVAFLVETRPLPHLPALFAHMIGVIPSEWTFRFMGSPEAIAFMRSSPLISRLEASGKITFLDLPSNYDLGSRETISQMFTDIHLYRDILAPAEHLLVFQPDSIFCAAAPLTLNDYLNWDWIGAPWSPTLTHGGNGGLSLRKVSKIIQVLKAGDRKHGDGELEDLWLSNRLVKLSGSKMANASISKTFSVESVWDEKPLGYHVGWLGVHHPQIWDKQEQVDHILKYCPEVKMILGMKLSNDKPKTVQDLTEP